MEMDHNGVRGPPQRPAAFEQSGMWIEFVEMPVRLFRISQCRAEPVLRVSAAFKLTSNPSTRHERGNEMLLAGIIVATFGLIFGIQKTNVLSEKLKEVSSILISVAGTSMGVTEVNTTYVSKEVDIIAVQEMSKAVIDSVKASEVRLMASHKEIARLLRELTIESSAKHDTVMAEIAAVDTCVDKHFYRVNAWLSDISAQLGDR